MRRFGKAPLAGQVYRRRPGAYAILRLGDSVLLTHQREPEPEFQLPGGGIDPGETAIGALHREVFEETGWRIAKPRKIGIYKRYAYMPEYDLWAEKICHVYVAQPVRRLGDPTEPGHSAHMVDVRQAASLVGSDGDAAFLSMVIP
ncbi:NUDIX domain-containing protein [Maritimibacter sp. DP1N21-5]|uniref:NUDIX domain-containing protein n=1 Tax=Maritimibacter sp. DP1N21-5 TaxID=2836867 RepID=UPI001C4697D4|nr:NUDIX hydrolase [Maritimibacter sp. DP1N21-5]MBV7410996.1 NUDIX hydrolase [Maritimibacter sp. DP1N21-5]